jgi:hypothetical protein
MLLDAGWVCIAVLSLAVVASSVSRQRGSKQAAGQGEELEPLVIVFIVLVFSIRVVILFLEVISISNH